ncbi:alpha/beta hydrolase-fold protein [Microbulbifer hainanensis]|uniref:alpha/beta hydrolase-fold protein n=1 Tax=Microbulbifer hainanensis TaxID=2735675 RepID=UPI001D00553E|nr:alpha/beta hydrolase-fold protein [Microbulbifer hainanensis]
MKLITLIFLIFFASAGKAFAREDENQTANVIGYSSTIESNILGESREISIYLPDGYSEKKKHYPVLYVLDGQRYSLQAIAYQKALLFQDKSPEFIVVGINTNSRKRRNLLDNQSIKFINFIKKELFPFINTRYRTNNMQMYFGWEMAGGFALEFFASEPDLFNAYFLASPTHFTKQRLDAVESFLQEHTSPLDVYFYYTLGNVETWSLDSNQKLSEILKKSSIPQQNWRFDLSNSDDHYTTPFNAFNKGLKLYFSDYEPIRFYSIKEFKEYGGISALRRHYKNRGKRYQISQDIHEDTKHYLLNQALKESDYAIFNELNLEFKDFITDYYKRAFWYVKYSNFHLENGNPEAALLLLNTGLIKFPDSAEIYAALGNLYLQQNKKAEAKSSYQKAIKFSVGDSEDKIEAYKLKLKNVL